MSFDATKLYHSPSDFFELSGNARMKLSAPAAYNLCEDVSRRDILIMGIEGGIKSQRGFEARYDAIWDGLDPPATREQAIENNKRAAEFIRQESTMMRHDSAPYNAFIFTVCHISGARV